MARFFLPIKLLHQFIGVLLQADVLGHLLIGSVFGVVLLVLRLLDGLGHHLSAGEVLAVGFPLSVFRVPKIQACFSKSLGDLGVGVVDVDDSVLFSWW